MASFLLFPLLAAIRYRNVVRAEANLRCEVGEERTTAVSIIAQPSSEGGRWGLCSRYLFFLVAITALLFVVGRGRVGREVFARILIEAIFHSVDQIPTGVEKDLIKCPQYRGAIRHLLSSLSK